MTTLRGTATVARTTTPEPTPLKFRDDVFVQDRITTGEESIARILLGGKAVVTIRERSNLTITETASSSIIEMTSGKIALSVDKSRVKPGESVEIKTPNAVAAIRGTIIVAEVDPPSAESPEVSTRFTLLTGVVDVTRIDPVTGRISGTAVVMKPMQTLAVSGFTAVPLAAPRPVTRVEADTVASGFSVRLPDPSPRANAGLIDDQVTEATKRTAPVTGHVKGKAKGKDDSDGNDRSDRSDRSARSATTTGRTGSTGGTTAGLATSVGSTEGDVTSSTGDPTGSVTGSFSGGAVRSSGATGGTKPRDIGNITSGTGSPVGSGSPAVGVIVDKTPKKGR